MKMSRIQANFQSVMDETGLNMRSWALKARLPETRVKAVMQGKSKHPRIDTLTALAVAAGVPVSRLIAASDPGINPKGGPDLSNEQEDQEFFVLWSGLSDDIKIGILTLMRGIAKTITNKVGHS